MAIKERSLRLFFLKRGFNYLDFFCRKGKERELIRWLFFLVPNFSFIGPKMVFLMRNCEF